MTHTNASILNREELHFAGAVFMLLALGLMYVYFLSATVVHVVMQKESSRAVYDLHSEIASLEAEYIDRQHAISEEIATLEGFVSVENKIFVDKGDTSLVLSR